MNILQKIENAIKTNNINANCCTLGPSDWKEFMEIFPAHEDGDKITVANNTFMVYKAEGPNETNTLIRDDNSIIGSYSERNDQYIEYITF